eukprot:TRINITY_DN14943_c0_g1::TRINITY_DN14943_c0_g1_i1::g.25755::m.25755 TRINITY_DN14943_c0_g1::TRINITY_DN14943_c0_g1_i1::g.25755  ORF type:complete len:311 (+),score=41.75,sp/Q59NN8/FES1_CANAL/34.21/2e-22,Fes1/PF08609.5/7.3e-13,Fes1/PF08609.5/2.2e+03,HEAT_2/PF13646.1/2.2,HEAT_2/PF13646.1/0.63,Arm/PF00514.18/3.4e+02,Arm/PF00514.18/17,Arm/PF00514.18/8,Arm/PF00514.18/47,HEAT/PF02985.17/3.6e+02,HEAT/PF02985.17/1.3,HEAT/PF02985.17/2.2e+03,HEAT/PF02985.17/1.1e+02,Neurochondrin/PF05536.6/0.0011,HEAT_EZ/PF135
MSLNQLLQFAIPHCDQQALREDAEAVNSGHTATRIKPLSPEEAEWLRQALESVTGPSETEQMKDSVKTLRDPQASEDDQHTALENLQLLLENLDNAGDFHKIGGYELMKDLLVSSHPDFRMYACWIMGGAVQNHPEVQERVLSAGFMEKFIELLRNDTEVDVKTKALFAISGLVRGCPPGEERFVTLSGMDSLCAALDNHNHAFFRKLVFFLQYLLSADAVHHVQHRRALITSGHLQHLIHALSMDDVDIVEKSLHVLLTLIITTTNALDIESLCKAGLKEQLTNLLSHSDNHVKSLAKTLLENISKRKQ